MATIWPCPGGPLPTPLSIALQAGLVCVLRELAECHADAASWGCSTSHGAGLARHRLHLARRNAVVMLCAWRSAGVDLGDGA